MAPAPSRAAQQKIRKARADSLRTAARPGGFFASISQPWVLAVILAVAHPCRLLSGAQSSVLHHG